MRSCSFSKSKNLGSWSLLQGDRNINIVAENTVASAVVGKLVGEALKLIFFFFFKKKFMITN